MAADAERYAAHLDRPRGRGRMPEDPFTGAAGGAACGDLIRISLTLTADGTAIADAGFDARGCGAATAAGSAVVTLLQGAPLLDAARIGPDEIAQELGGLSPAKAHAAELAADALHRALGSAARARAALPESPARVLVAMSGGVDSAVAALLCARGGAEVVAVTLELWADPDNDGERSCCSAQAVRGARAIAHSLGLAHLSLDLRAEFRAGVVDPWLADHAAGLTPNPCVRCNGSVRLDAMLELAIRLGARELATGHYARVARRPGGGPLLQSAADAAKDQSYMLAGLSPESLSRMRFPLGEIESKRAVREIARRHGLPVASKRDSQDLCFLAGTGRAAFLSRHGRATARPGAIVDRGGKLLGRHGGHSGYTVGQRRGIGIGGGRNGGEALYVLATDARSNTVTVGPRDQLATREVRLRAVTLHRGAEEVDGVKLRYRSPVTRGRLRQAVGPGPHAALDVHLEQPVAGAAPGQLASLMSGDVIVGHGTIAAYTPAGR